MTYKIGFFYIPAQKVHSYKNGIGGFEDLLPLYQGMVFLDIRYESSTNSLVHIACSKHFDKIKDLSMVPMYIRTRNGNDINWLRTSYTKPYNKIHLPDIRENNGYIQTKRDFLCR